MQSSMMAQPYNVHTQPTEYLGSYQGYYKRNKSADERLAGFDATWFAGKKVLDIGSNEGAITLAIAKLFQPTIIVGIDLDQRLIDAGIPLELFYSHFLDVILPSFIQEIAQSSAPSLLTNKT